MNIDWTELLMDIHDGDVIPVIGPSASMVVDADDGQQKTFLNWLAPRLARKLSIDYTDGSSLNQVACQHIMQRLPRNKIYRGIRAIMEEDGKKLAIPQPLLDLTSITDFRLFFSSSFDPFLEQALAEVRPGFDARKHRYAFHPAKPVDLPTPLPAPFLYHILGHIEQNEDFAVWEEDYLEYICGLLTTPQDSLKQLQTALSGKSLLLIGAPFNDWIVRFFLRAAKGQRLSDARHNTPHIDYIADSSSDLSEPMVFFFDKVIGSPNIIPSSPADFVAELAQRWRDRYGSETQEDEGPKIDVPDECEPGAVFISYSRDDSAAAVAFYTGLRDAGIPAWLDLNELTPGIDWEKRLRAMVRMRCSMFVSLISAATEADAGKDTKDRRFVHTEREWAAGRHEPGFTFYIPVIIDDTDPANIVGEPEVFCGRSNSITLLGGQTNDTFLGQIKRYHQTYQRELCIPE